MDLFILLWILPGLPGLTVTMREHILKTEMSSTLSCFPHFSPE